MLPRQPHSVLPSLSILRQASGRRQHNPDPVWGLRIEIPNFPKLPHHPKVGVGFTLAADIAPQLSELPRNKLGVLFANSSLIYSSQREVVVWLHHGCLSELGLRGLPLWQVLFGCVIVIPATLILGFWFYATPNVLKDSRRKHLPPGPRGLPFIGNYFDLADGDSTPAKAREWTQKYGDVFYTKIGGADYVWLSSPKAVRDLMDKKSAIHSSRPPAPLAHNVASAGRRQLFMEYGPQYRTVRKISHALLNITKSTAYQPVQDLESKQLMYDLLHDPDHFYDHNRRYSASVIISVTYGHRIGTWDNHLAKSVYQVVNNMQAHATPGTWMVDTFPPIQNLPQIFFGNWRKFGQKCHEHDAPIYLGLWNDLKKEIDNGTAKQCFCKDFYESDPEKQGLDTLQAAYQVGGLVEAGSETTFAALDFFLNFATLNPHVVKKAQEEVDRVVGSDRYPTWEDEENLPYIRAIIKELLRMRPPNKVGIHHASTEDDWYEGHFIQKGSTVVIN
jgi:cytochrome P450